MTITGTSNFQTLAAAILYYLAQCETNAECRALVASKIQAKEICIGKPTLQKGEKLLLNRQEGRYLIQS